MTTPAKIHADKIIENPAAFFDHPMDLVKTGQLTQAEKKEALDKWELDSRLMAIATEEGMTGGEPALQDEVAQAKVALNIESERPSGPTKLG